MALMIDELERRCGAVRLDDDQFSIVITVAQTRALIECVRALERFMEEVLPDMGEYLFGGMREDIIAKRIEDAQTALKRLEA